MTVPAELDRNLRCIEYICKFTLVVFRTNDTKPAVSIFRFVLAVVLFALSSYQFSYMMWIAFQKLFDGDIVASLLLGTWGFKIYVTLVFAIYWQFGHFQRIFSTQTWPPKTIKRFNTSFSFKLQVFVVYFIFTFLSAFVILMQLKSIADYYFPYWTSYQMVAHEIFDGFGPKLGGIAIFSIGHMCLVWVWMLLFYIVVLQNVHERMSMFNEEIKQIGHETTNPEKLTKDLIGKYKDLTKLASLIRASNSIFETYAFVMVGLNIGTTVFMLAIFFYLLAHSTSTAIFYLGNVFVMLIELTVLIIYPAKIHATIQQVETEMFTNERIWFPHNEKIYQIANTMIAYAKQGNLGITLWDVAPITKSMILTAASLVLTYILLVQQIGYGNGTFQMNSTAPELSQHFGDL